jgi:protocatechuate 4,5-dioxygenase alpha chain
MNKLKDALKGIPGTTVFDATQSRIGYHLNMWCMTLQSAENRAAFKADERVYLDKDLDKYPLGAEQRQAVLDRDYNRMLELGGNIYFLSKLAAVDGHSFQQIAASMSGVPLAEFQQMMLAGGRSPQAPVNPPKGKQ